MTPFGSFPAAWPVMQRLDLVAPPVAAALRLLDADHGCDEIQVVDTAPEHAETVTLCAQHDVPMDVSANCVIVAGKRAGVVKHAACVVLATTRADVNRTVRKALDVRKASFAPMEQAVELTGMEYGGITPPGLPDSWPLMVDQAVTETPFVMVGSGRRRGKMIMPGKLVAELPNASVVTGLGI